MVCHGMDLFLISVHLQLSWIKTKVCVLFQTVHTHVCILLCSHMDLYVCVLNVYFCTCVMFGVQQKHISFRVYILGFFGAITDYTSVLFL